MSAAASSHQFADASTAQIPGLSSPLVTLIIRQQPESARVAVGKEKDRKPVDPPPIVQMTVSQNHDPNFNFLQSPYIFMSVILVPIKIPEGSTPTNLGAALAGTLVSSLHRLKDTNNHDAAFFVFGDLSVKIEGRFQLQFNLYEMRRSECFHIKSILSDVFTVHATKHFPGMTESTFLTRSFSDQGVRLRLRKEPRTLLRKRGPASEDYVPRHYNKAGGGGGRSNQGDPSVKSESSQQSQGELPPSMLPMQSPSLENRPPVNRGYSYQSADSFSPSFSDEPNIKRPRTGSEHSHGQAFGQPLSLASPQYPSRMFPESQQQSPYIYTQPSQTPTYGGYYAQSPQSATSTRDAAYGRYPIQQSNVSSYNTMPQQRSPQSFYPPQQQTFQSPQQYAMPQMGGQTTPQRINTSLGMMDRPQLSLAIGGPSMVAPPIYGRMQTANYGSFTSPIEDRRERYDNLYQTQGAGLPIGMEAAPFIPRTSSGSINTTSGPGMDEYQ